MMTSTSKQNYPKGPISWMARNSVTANLLMCILLFGGLIVASRIKQEIFPDLDLDVVSVSVIYPGASPEEIEQGIILVVEDEIRALDGIKRVRSTALEGVGVINAELLLGEDSDKLLQNVKNVVDGVLTFPEDAEKPIVNLIEPINHVISLILYGDQTERVLRTFAENVREDLLARGEITLVKLSGIRPLEIAIEIPQHRLREHELTLEQVATLVQETALELPGGGVKTNGGEVLLRTQERRDYGHQFTNIPIITNSTGSQLRLGDIAEIRDGFAETELEAFFNGKRAVKVDIFRIGNQTPISIADEVYRYIDEINPSLPEGIDITAWDDSAELYRDRISLLARNAFLGLFLVLILLGLFLEPRLAFWVTLGIPVSIIGSFLFIPLTGASINMISLFAFIVTLGIIVDDAVVVGEIIFQKREQGAGYLESAIEGARAISGPVIFAVLTNIAAFTPLLFVPGSTGKIFLQIPAIVIAVFIVSLIESLLILPAHLAHQRKKTAFWRTLGIPRIFLDKHLRRFIHGAYVPFIRSCLRYHYLTFTVGLSVLTIMIILMIGGHIRFSYLPKVDSDLIVAEATLPFGVAIEESRRTQKALVSSAAQALQDTEGPQISRGLFTLIGSKIEQPGGPPNSNTGNSGSHIIGAQLALVPSDQRTISGLEFADRWREATGPLQGIDTMSFSASLGNQGGSAIDIQLAHTSKESLESAAIELATILENYAGAQDLSSGVKLGKTQFSFHLKAAGRSLGLTVQDLARQVRHAFYGAEALRQQRGRNEVKVLVRLPEKERRALHTVEEFILQGPGGIEVPLSEAARVERGRAFTDIKRTDGRRTISVTGDVDEKLGNANEIVAHVIKNELPSLIARYPGLSYSLEGQQREQRESMEAIGVGFLFALMAIYALMAIPFKSYSQPLIVMLSIPFGIVGALIGHLLLGYELSIISMFGIIALSGVVVNDALVLLVTTNELRRERGFSSRMAIRHAAVQRFRPIMLTSLTTFFGLAPMIFETSLQARFLVPMAVSLGFGILFATLIVLIIVPATYCILEDLRDLARKN